MVAITIDSIGNERFARSFNRWAEDCKDLRKPFNEIGNDFYRANKRNFNAEGTPQKFKELSEKYAEWKNLHYPGRPILVLTGRLKRSLTGEAQTENQDSIRNIKFKSAEFATRLPYAVTQYYAGRKAVQLTEYRKRKWAKILQRYIVMQYKIRMNRPVGVG